MLHLAGLILSLPLPAVAQPVSPTEQSPMTIEIARNVRVTHTAAPFVEPSIAAHPSDPQRMIISSTEMIRGDDLLARAFLTRDGGATWASSPLPGMGEGVRNAIDNWVTFAPEGFAYLSSMPRTRSVEWRRSIVAYRSFDKGDTWLGPTVIAGASFDRPVISAGDGGAVYIAVTASRVEELGFRAQAGVEGVLVLSSIDSGASFRPTGFFAPDELGHQAQNPLPLPDGTLLVPYGDYPLRSGHRLSSSRVFVIRSRDGGRTFEPPRFVGDIPRAFGGFFHLAVDAASQRFAGRVYAAWNGGDIGPDRRRGVRRDVSVAVSADGGETWSAPKTLYAVGAGPAYFSAIAVSPNGTVGIGWVQHESAVNKADCYRAYFSASVDGGATFAPPRAVSNAVSCPTSQEHTVPLNSLGERSILQRWARGGDYIGMAATSDGRFHLVWIDGRDGPFQVYTAAIVVRSDSRTRQGQSRRAAAMTERRRLESQP